MKKETFVKAIELIKEHRKREDTFLAGLDAVSPDTNNDTFIYSAYESFLVELLAEELSDKDDVLGWWIYDTEFGTQEKFRSIFIADTEIELDTAEKLYDYLTNK